jgi:TPR repeat protein
VSFSTTLAADAAANLARRIAAVAVTCLLMAADWAHGDTATGRAAYDRGDYATAMSEWQSTPDHGDAEAQFRLGSLYELGAGEAAST